MQRSVLNRFLGALGRPHPKSSPLIHVRALQAPAAQLPFEGEMAPRDYVAFLLHVDAEIEHALMVQYLYAAYALGGPQIPAQHRQKVLGWKEVILGIAKEEMGHLVTVQNLLRLIGAPLNFGRQDFPWDVPFYPFPFTLEPLTLDSLAKYVYTESPKDWEGPDAKEILERVEISVPTPHRVAELFASLQDLIGKSSFLHDDVFQSDTYPYQASWDEWGRGYAGGRRGNATAANPAGVPNVIVQALASRDDAMAALKAIAEQGEAPPNDAEDQPSHFARFLNIYREMKEMVAEGVAPSLPVATNPYVPPSAASGAVGDGLAKTRAVTHPEARLWAQLHNVRYRMLLDSFAHSFVLEPGAAAAPIASARGAVINATFGEMYNLRAISEILMQLPLSGSKQKRPLHAGPPFQMPYTFDSPLSEPNRWRRLIDSLGAAARLIEQLLHTAPRSRHAYLQSMRQVDEQLLDVARSILSAGGRR